MSAFDLGEGMFPVPLWQAGAVNIESQQRFRTIHSQPHACIRCRFLIQSVTRRLTAAVLRTRRCGPFDSRRRRRNPHPIPAKIPGPARSEPLTSLVAAPWLRRRAVDGAEDGRAERVPRRAARRRRRAHAEGDAARNPGRNRPFRGPPPDRPRLVSMSIHCQPTVHDARQVGSRACGLRAAGSGRDKRPRTLANRRPIRVFRVALTRG